jgi:hypothetical protein
MIMSDDKRIIVLADPSEVAAMLVIVQNNAKRGLMCSMSGAFKMGAKFLAAVIDAGLENDVRQLLAEIAAQKRATAAPVAHRPSDLQELTGDELPGEEVV